MKRNKKQEQKNNISRGRREKRHVGSKQVWRREGKKNVL